MVEGDNTTHEFLWLVILGGVVCFAMACGIGANDVANAFSTSVGAKSVTLKQAVIIAAVFEFAGALFLGAEVTDTVRKKITDYSAFEGEEDILMLGMFCSLCAAALWLFLATRFSLPVSTTQTIIGAIIGFVLSVKGPQAIVWSSVYNIIIFWVASPVLSGIGMCILFISIRGLVLRRENSYALVIRLWPIFVFVVVFIMALFLMMKGLARFDVGDSIGIAEASWIAIVVGVVAAILSYFIFIRTGLVQKFVIKSLGTSAISKEETDAQETPMNVISRDMEVSKSSMNDNNNHNNNNSMALRTPTEDTAIYMDDSPDNNNSNVNGNENENENENENGHGNGHGNEHGIEHDNNNRGDSVPPASDDDESDAENAGQESRLQLLKKRAAYGITVDIHSDLDQLERELHSKSEKFDPRTEKAFAWLQVCTATLDVFAHGSNDVANAVAPFAAMVSLYEVAGLRASVAVPIWVLALGAVGMSVGLSTYGYKIMKCLGVRMATMSATRGYCIELSSALVVIIASYHGYPASTTHAQVGATIGAGLCELVQKDSKLTLKQVVNWKLSAQVFLGWIFTLIVSGLTSAAMFSFMAYSPYAGDVKHG